MSLRIAMAMKVRNEDDILEDNLRFHSAQGIDFFLITDNGSTDRTPEILRGYERAGRAQVIEEPTTNMHDVGHEWYTRMARLAATEHGADWVVIADADEFWLPLSGTLRETLASVPDRYGILIGARAEFVPRPDGPGSFAARLVVRERRALLRPKIAFRADPGAVIWHRGGHDVAYVPSGEDLRSAFRPPGRAVLRGVRDEEEGAGGSEPVPAPLFNARVLHFPVRSQEQFARRIEAAARHEGPDERTGKRARLRKRFEAEGAEGLYSELALDDDTVEAGIREGVLVRDTRLRDYLARVPDPLVDASADPPAAPALPADELERERAELELDAMATLARHQRLTEVRLTSAREKLLGADWRAIEREAKRQAAKADRRLERVKKLQGKVRRLRAELRRERQRPWTRLRQAVIAPLTLYAAATISGSGKVQLILDPAQLVRRVYPGAPGEGIADASSGPMVLAGRALVVDDSRAIREAMTSMLGREGWIVDVAEDGARALQMARQLKYDLVVTDLEMPELGGFELIARLRKDERFQTTPIVIITSRANPEHRRKAKDLGVRALVAKPITRRKLLEALASRLEPTR